MPDKKRLAIIRGPNLNSWEMQNYLPLMDSFHIVGFTSYLHNYSINNIPFKVKKLVSFGQIFKPRICRAVINKMIGDYHDLQGLSGELNRFDIVHCVETSYYCTYQATKLKERYKYKLLVMVWENIPFLKIDKTTERHKKYIFEKADLFLPVSERAKQVLILEGVAEEKIKLQMPGIDVEHFKPAPKDLMLLSQIGCNKEDFIILFIANLYREKGIYDLIFAFRLFLNQIGNRSKIKLLIAGKGKEEKRIKEWIVKLNLVDHAKLIGSYSYDIMPKIHNLADIFVLPSIPVIDWQEQFGYVLIESMACGKALISTLSGSIPEVVGKCGMLIQPNDFYSLVQAFDTLYNNNNLRKDYGIAARKRAEELFNVKNTSRRLKELFENI